MTKTVLRRLAGLGIALFGVFVLFSGLFVPIGVNMRDRDVVPAPESWAAAWIIGVGTLLALWPARGRDADSSR